MGTPVLAGATLTSGAVYTMTNDTAGNGVVVFQRDSEGVLTYLETMPTGGVGSDTGGVPIDPLGSQGSLTLSKDGRWLLAVNAGSDDLSVFRIMPDGLELTDLVSSDGVRPTSVTISGTTVYVLNNGGDQNITGFDLAPDGMLSPKPDSTRLLGAGDYGQVGFDPQGDWLAVTDKAGNRILVYGVDGDGMPSTDSTISPSSGTTPFALVFDHRSNLLVVEVNDGDGAVSSYAIGSDGALDVISPSVVNGQVAACWIAGTSSGDVYTTNPGSTSISSYIESPGGAVTLSDATAATGITTLDADVSVNGRFLYALDPVAGGIYAYGINPDGSLMPIGFADVGLTIFAQGMAVQ